MTYYTSVIILCWLSLSVLGILAWENNRLSKRDKKLFYLVYTLVATAALMEWLGIKLNGNASYSDTLLRIVKCADYILTPAAGAAIVLHFKSRSIWKKIICGIICANTLFQIISALTGWMVVIDAGHFYSHGVLYPVYMAFYLILIVFIGIEFITFGQNYRKQNRASLYSVLIVVLASVLMQELLGGEIRTAYLGLVLGLGMLFIHITEFSQLESDDVIEKQEIAITTDALTGIANRYAYEKALNMLDEAKELPENLTMFSIDINGLKTVNDTLGHLAGDELICGTADVVKGTFKNDGVCYRTGGDEFIVICDMDENRTKEMVELLKQNAAAWHGKMVNELHFATGYARAVDYPELTAEKLVAVADKVMYQEKAEYYRENSIERDLNHKVVAVKNNN